MYFSCRKMVNFVHPKAIVMPPMNTIKRMLFTWTGLTAGGSTVATAATATATGSFGNLFVPIIAGILFFAFLAALFALYRLRNYKRTCEQAQKTLADKEEREERLRIQLKTQTETYERRLAETFREKEETLKQIRAQQQETENKLNEAEQLHSTFFTYTVHEMRTPLSLVLGTLNLLTQNTRLDSETCAQLLSAYRNALALQDLADQLIDTRHAATISKHLRIARYNIVDITRQISDLFIDWIAMNRIDFRLSVQSPELWIWIDRRKMEYALRTLLSNSFQNTYLYGKISVAISIVRDEEKKGYCTITVQDDGLNENESTRRGLKQIADMADDLGGKFEHTDMEQEGPTQYIIYMPLGKRHLLEKPVEFVEPEGDLVKLNTIQKEEIADLIQITSEKEQTGKKLLVIDDSDQIRWFLKHVFTNEYQILEARNGEEGIACASKEMPSLILCDVMMPGKDGFDTCRELKTNLKTSQIPIIMLTAKVESEDVITGIENGADDYITKPFSVEVLRSKVKNLLKQREKLQQYFTRSLLSADLSGQANTTILPEGEENLFMGSVVKCIEKHINDPKFEAKVLAEELCMSLPTLYRKIKQHSDCSILELTRTVRLKKAAELISTQLYSIQEVSEMVGFNDAATFRKRFTEQFGVTPSGYAQGKKA